MANYQMIELMPRSEWNKTDKREWRDPREAGKSNEELFEDILKHMVMGEVRKEPGFDYKKPAERMLEHCAVDDMDLSTYKPLAYRGEALSSAARMAFNKHHPLVFTPDLVYGYLVKGICTHINKFPEELRKLYVSFEGKKTLIYRNDSLVMGSKDNDWSHMFQHFASKLKEETKGNSVVQDDLRFSTSTRVTEAHRNVLAMEAMKSYFEFKCYTMCGMSCIILEGQEEDWRLLKETIINQLSEINKFCDENPEAEKASLKWWSPAVEVMLDNFLSTFITSSKGEELSEDMKLWWKTIYKYNAAFGSGGRATVTGWLNVMYPYTNAGKELQRNPWVVHCGPFIKDNEAVKKHFESYSQPPEEDDDGWGRKYGPDEVEDDDFPAYHASVPYIWNYHGTEFNMNILIGYSVLGQVAVDGAKYPKGTIKPFPAWVIYHVNSLPDGEPI